MSKKRKPKPDPAPVVLPLRSFAVDGHTYTDGDLLTVVTPELGVITAPIQFESYADASIMNMCLGWVHTPLPCGNERVNAMLNFTATRFTACNGTVMDSNRLHLGYFCRCRNHDTELRWVLGVTHVPGMVRAGLSERPRNAMGRHVARRHPLVEGFPVVVPQMLPVMPPAIPAPIFKPVQLQLFS